MSYLQRINYMTIVTCVEGPCDSFRMHRFKHVGWFITITLRAVPMEETTTVSILSIGYRIKKLFSPLHDFVLVSKLNLPNHSLYFNLASSDPLHI
jgi:hypothetical protein